MTLPDGVLYKAEPHTIAKHKLLTNYLNAWFEIIDRSKPFKALVYIDSHCHRGEYQHDIPGSPIWAFKLATERERPLESKVILRFIDSDQNCIDKLDRKLKLLNKPANVEYECVHGEFSKTVLPMLAGIDKKLGRQEPTFVFIDPWGIKIPFRVVSGILSRNSAEVLVFFNTKALIRNLDNNDGQFHVIEMFGTEKVLEATKEGKNKAQWLCNLYVAQLRSVTRMDYFCCFKMKDKHGNLISYLIFATKNKTGFLKMKESMWRLDKSGKFEFSDKEYSSSQEYLFFGPDTSELSDFIREKLIARTHFRGKAIREFTEFASQFLNKHKTEVLKSMEENKQINVGGTSPNGKARRGGQYPDWCTIEWIGD